jgi:NTP pyrophosphatase (non-canonical NTP hydrolase)
MTPQEYQHQVLRTLYMDLTTSERLGLCGLGLSGEIGEVTDLLKKHLYHRSGKPLDTEKLKDEMGDVLWYFAVLCSTLGITIEEVMQVNIDKLNARHPHGFTPLYSSDSRTSAKGEQA